MTDRNPSAANPAATLSGVWADAWRDLGLAVRTARRQPAFTLFIVLTLGLGIGANSAMFGILDRLLLSSPPHIVDPDGVARVFIEKSPKGRERFSMATVSYPSFRDLAESRSMARVAAVATGQMILGSGADARAITASKVSGGYFELLGTRPALGRFFGEEEDQPPSGTAVAVVGHTFWTRDLGGSAAAVGSAIHLDGTVYTVIGIAPEGFTGDGLFAIDVWVPLQAGRASQPAGWRDDRGLRLVSLLGRLRPGVGRGPASEEATRLYRRGMEGQFFADPDDRVALTAMIPGVGPGGISEQGRIALWLSGVALIVFLIAIANVTNLLLQRASQRRQEIAVRLALGMGRLRLARQWVIESLLLAVLGGGVGLLVARWGGDLIRITLLPYMARPEGIDWRLLGVTGATVLAAGLLAGLLPAFQAGSSSLLAALQSGRQARTFRRSRLRTGLLLVQTALSVILLVGSGLFVRSFHNVRTQDFGFSTASTLLATLQFAPGTPMSRQDDVYREALGRLRTVPGIVTVIPTDSLPFGPTSAPSLDVPGVDLSVFPQSPFLNAAVPEYFDVMGMRILRGRAFTAADDAGGTPVAIVSETMAKTLWPGQSALGRCVRAGFVFDPAEVKQMPCREVVGVVNDARPRSITPEPQPVMQFYVPYEQVPPAPVPDQPAISGLLIRTAGDPKLQVHPVQRALQSYASDLLYANVRPYQEIIDPKMRVWQLGATLFTAFGGLALAMAAIGLYGVLSYMVAHRAKEMGIRIAMGARSADLIRLVVGEGLFFAAIGIVAGGVAALLAGRWIEPMLFGTSPWDPAVLAGVAATLTLVALAASLLPALRATRTDPNLALRAD